MCRYSAFSVAVWWCSLQGTKYSTTRRRSEATFDAVKLVHAGQRVACWCKPSAAWVVVCGRVFAARGAADSVRTVVLTISFPPLIVLVHNTPTNAKSSIIFFNSDLLYFPVCSFSEIAVFLYCRVFFMGEFVRRKLPICQAFLLWENSFVVNCQLAV